jgi:heat shock protein HtpX
MAASTVGLKTHIWNNNIRAALFLLFYPIVITATYMSLIGAVFFYLAYDSKDISKPTRYLHIFETTVINYWYVPYVLILFFLLIVFVLNHDRMEKHLDMHPVSRVKNPELYSLLENLCISRGLSTPHFFIKTHDSCNAYTAGLTKNTYQIVVTSGLLEKLNAEEIKAVLAHELTHLINGDTRLIFLTGTVTHIFRTLAELIWPTKDDSSWSIGNINNFGIVVLWFVVWCVLKLANIGVLFTQLFISRKREYIADAGAIELTKNPHALISALEKIEGSTFGFDTNENIKSALINYHESGLFSTHPSIEERVAAISTFSRIEASFSSPWGQKNVS